MQMKSQWVQSIKILGKGLVDFVSLTEVGVDIVDVGVLVGVLLGMDVGELVGVEVGVYDSRKRQNKSKILIQGLKLVI